MLAALERNLLRPNGAVVKNQRYLAVHLRRLDELNFCHALPGVHDIERHGGKNSSTALEKEAGGV